mgnify:CR=1 FL=1
MHEKEESVGYKHLIHKYQKIGFNMDENTLKDLYFELCSLKYDEKTVCDMQQSFANEISISKAENIVKIDELVKKPEKFICNECGSLFKYNSGLKRHLEAKRCNLKNFHYILRLLTTLEGRL